MVLVPTWVGQISFGTSPSEQGKRKGPIKRPISYRENNNGDTMVGPPLESAQGRSKRDPRNCLRASVGRQQRRATRRPASPGS